MSVRDYCIDDLSRIEEMNAFCAVSIRFHGDIRPENVLCAVNEKGDIVGAGYLKLGETGARCMLEVSTFTDEAHAGDLAIEGMLVDGFNRRIREIKRMMPEKDVYLRSLCEADEIDRIQLFMERGFRLHAVIPVMKRDLSKKTQHHKIPDNVQIKELSFTDDEIIKYVNADLMTGEDPQSRAEVRFKSGHPSFKCFAAMCGSEVVGATSVWDISDERAATEHIFVVESYRRKNIAKELIATALDELRRRGRKIATLCVRGTNMPAIKLYLSCGYTLYYNLIELRDE